jgi:hypothetical protein
VWHISPEGFRELRYSCLLSAKACADLLGCSVSSVKAWDRGVCFPWKKLYLQRRFSAQLARKTLHRWCDALTKLHQCQRNAEKSVPALLTQPSRAVFTAEKW